MKLSDYVIDFLVRDGVKHVFMLPGGSAMHLNESLGRRDEIEYVCHLHEQAASIAAEAYAKVTNKLGVVMVTSGPAGTNAVTGCAGAWLDSMPCLFLSGQVKRADLKGDTGVRQLGTQEVDIVSIVRPITKYAATVMEPERIRWHLEQALYLARSGRPGPVWLDFPLDIQAMQVEPEKLEGFTANESKERGGEDLGAHVKQLVELLQKVERPVIVAGNGLRISGALSEFARFLAIAKIPVLTTWLAMDVIADAHPLFAGRPGAIAPRGANFALQNADLMLVIGSRLDMAFTGYAHEKLARSAVKIMVDVDETEIAKMNTRIDLPIIADAGDFLRVFVRELEGKSLPDYGAWTKRCKEWKLRYPVVQDEHRTPGRVSVYHFSEVLSQELSGNEVLVSGSSGSAVELFLLVFAVKEGQRVFHTRGLGAMGFGLPATIGACLGAERRPTVSVDGDGGFQMNIQELETVKRLQLPIKFFVINNNGYASIRSSQQNVFKHLVAADSSSGLTLPNLLKVADAYGLGTARIENQTDLAAQVRHVLQMEGPVVCEVMALPEEVRAPRLSSAQRPDGSIVSKPLEDLWPFLEREEFRQNMLVPTIDE